MVNVEYLVIDKKTAAVNIEDRMVDMWSPMLIFTKRDGGEGRDVTRRVKNRLSIRNIKC